MYRWLYASAVLSIAGVSLARDAAACAASIPDAFVIKKVLGTPDPRVETHGMSDALPLRGRRPEVEIRLRRSGPLADAPVRAVLGGETLRRAAADPLEGAARGDDSLVFALPGRPERFDGSEFRLFVGDQLVQHWMLEFRKGLSGPCPEPGSAERPAQRPPHAEPSPGVAPGPSPATVSRPDPGPVAARSFSCSVNRAAQSADLGSALLPLLALCLAGARRSRRRGP